MDIMTLRDLMIVGIPETVIMLITGLIIGMSRSSYKKMKFIKTRIIISTLIILAGTFFIRGSLSDIQSITLAVLVLYISSFRFTFDMNIRKSIAAGSIVMLIIVSSEIAMTPVLGYLSENVYFQDRVIVTTITRITQLIIAVVLYKTNFYIGHLNIVSGKWNELSLKEKCTSIAFILLIIISIQFSTSYSDLYIKLNIIGMNLQGMEFSTNMIVYFLQNIFFILLVFYMINRTRKYYIYEEFLQKGDQEILFDLLDLADEKTIEKYIEISKLYLEERLKEVKSNE